MYEIITVATHYEGKLDALINNDYNAHITVLGMGKKWTGFRMKYELIYDYIKSMDDNKIIIFLDGFDSAIVNDPSKAIQKFKSKNYKLLFSEDPPLPFFDFLREKCFTTCKENKILNAGMYMGYVKYLKPYLQYNLKQKCKDDQRTGNLSCKKFDISIDTNNEIFQNIKGNTPIKKNTIFVSYPGKITIKRSFRATLEYGQFLLNWFLLLFIIVIPLFIYKKWNIPLIIFMSIFILYFSMMDTSCI